MSAPRICFVGAGSVEFTAMLIADILGYPELENVTFSLHDIDAERLETAERVARATAEQLGAAPTVEANSDRRAALEGADYIINMIQVGGHAATLIDLEIPARYGLRQTIGDTLGVGGVFRALRTIPVMEAMAGDMSEVCPRPGSSTTRTRWRCSAGRPTPAARKRGSSASATRSRTPPPSWRS